MGWRFRKNHQTQIYRYLSTRDGQTILQKDIAADTGVGKNTVSRDLKKFERWNIIERDGKRIYLKDV